MLKSENLRFILTNAKNNNLNYENRIVPFLFPMPVKTVFFIIDSDAVLLICLENYFASKDHFSGFSSKLGKNIYAIVCYCV